MHMSPVLNGSSEIQRIERSDVIGKHDRVMFIFIPKTATYNIVTFIITITASTISN